MHMNNLYTFYYCFENYDKSFGFFPLILYLLKRIGLQRFNTVCYGHFFFFFFFFGGGGGGGGGVVGVGLGVGMEELWLFLSLYHL